MRSLDDRNSPWTKNQKMNVLSIIINNIFRLKNSSEFSLASVFVVWRFSVLEGIVLFDTPPPAIHSAQKGRLDFNLNAHNSGF